MILIKGMNKPRNCWECPLTRKKKNGIISCNAAGNRYVDDQMGLHKEAPPIWCPIKEVKE